MAKIDPHGQTENAQGTLGAGLWLIVGGFASISALLFLCGGFRIVGGPWGIVIPAGAAAAVASRLLCQSPSRPGRKLGLGLAFALKSAVVTGGGTMLVYASATTGRPLADGALAKLDRLVGYDWRWYSRLFVDGNVLTDLILSSYIWIFLLPFAVILMLAVTDRVRELEKYVLTMIVGLIVTNMVFSLYPATTAWIHDGLSYAEIRRYHLPQADGGWIGDLLRIREGGGRVLHGIGGSGLVAFPSFHCASALIFIRATWTVRLARPAMLLANGLMILATPIAGGHYLVDLIGGALVALLSVCAVEAAYPRLVAAQRRTRRGQDAAQPGAPVTAA